MPTLALRIARILMGAAIVGCPGCTIAAWSPVGWWPAETLPPEEIAAGALAEDDRLHLCVTHEHGDAVVYIVSLEPLRAGVEQAESAGWLETGVEATTGATLPQSVRPVQVVPLQTLTALHQAAVLPDAPPAGTWDGILLQLGPHGRTVWIMDATTPRLVLAAPLPEPDERYGHVGKRILVTPLTLAVDAVLLVPVYLPALLLKAAGVDFGH